MDISGEQPKLPEDSVGKKGSASASERLRNAQQATEIGLREIFSSPESRRPGTPQYMAFFDSYDFASRDYSYKESESRVSRSIASKQTPFPDQMEDLNLSRLRFALVKERIAQRESQIPDYSTFHRRIEKLVQDECGDDDLGIVRALGALKDIVLKPNSK